jgi:hypothetical protein
MGMANGKKVPLVRILDVVHNKILVLGNVLCPHTSCGEKRHQEDETMDSISHRGIKIFVETHLKIFEFCCR